MWWTTSFFPFDGHQVRACRCPDERSSPSIPSSIPTSSFSFSSIFHTIFCIYNATAVTPFLLQCFKSFRLFDRYVRPAYTDRFFDEKKKKKKDRPQEFNKIGIVDTLGNGRYLQPSPLILWSLINNFFKGIKLFRVWINLKNLFIPLVNKLNNIVKW